eukprot:CAMPEP_0114657522 /NCGR_PEP_ID=MMETSP0191-20121206/14085_1 /TAXON_ID=126664 /ORGANISM="Sorites sp." /LENGTH=205 /DNA_ID=CAMNT_0001877135 /DNA_START=1320 /DNA_END=1937 /DNA_ORIENTATION=+
MEQYNDNINSNDEFSNNDIDFEYRELLLDVFNYGYDFKYGFGNMVDNGIIDPLKVTRYALIDSGCISGLMLTTETVVIEIPQPDPGVPGYDPGDPIDPTQAKTPPHWGYEDDEHLQEQGLLPDDYFIPNTPRKPQNQYDSIGNMAGSDDWTGKLFANNYYPSHVPRNPDYDGSIPPFQFDSPRANNPNWKPVPKRSGPQTILKKP